MYNLRPMTLAHDRMAVGLAALLPLLLPLAGCPTTDTPLDPVANTTIAAGRYSGVRNCQVLCSGQVPVTTDPAEDLFELTADGAVLVQDVPLVAGSSITTTLGTVNTVIRIGSSGGALVIDFNVRDLSGAAGRSTFVYTRLDEARIGLDISQQIILTGSGGVTCTTLCSTTLIAE